LRFTVTAQGKDSVVLTGLALEAVLAGYTGANVEVEVYRNNTNLPNRVGT
jgi:hypothetical protein